MANDYSKKYLDPRWQKRRLEILSRDGFACKRCCDNENTLHVHHLYYVSGREPWEYPNGALVTLCDECHKEEHAEGQPNADVISTICDNIGYYECLSEAATSSAIFKICSNPSDIAKLSSLLFYYGNNNLSIDDLTTYLENKISGDKS